MAPVRMVSAQRDFSAGEVDPELKRDDERPEFKTGLRQCSNFRILNSRKLANRSGRRALFKESDRVEEILMAPGVTYYLAFPSGFLRIYNSAGTQVFSEARPWDATTAKDVVWAVYDKSIYITAAGMPPRVLTWDGVTTWTAADYAETISSGDQKRTVFYRLAPKSITMFPSGATGAINLVFSAAVLTAAMVGDRFRYIGRQMTITGVTPPGLLGTATVNEPLPGSQILNFAIDPRSIFQLGDLVQGTISGAQGYVVTTAVGSIGVQLMSTAVSGIANPPGTSRLQPTAVVGFVATDVIVGPGGSIATSGVGAIGGPNAVPFWDQEIMRRNPPRSVFVDQNRLGFCNFPDVPSGIAWSAIANFNDLYPGANPDSAIFELVPNKSQVLYVVPGMDASQFVFCDNRLYYIPITVTNPLKPGSVQFSTISEDECGAVQPRRAGEFILYVIGGLTQVMAVRISGAYTRYYRTEPVTELSGHLFTSIKAIAIMTASASFSERYAFVLNQDGSVVVGKYNYDKNAELSGTIGWTPGTGNGAVKWVSCKGGNTLFTTSYAPNNIAAVQVVEQLDDSRYLDGSQKYNTQPTGLPIPGGKGPLWWLANGAVDLMDGPLGNRMMGTYQIDANGFLVPQNNAGEDFTSANLIVGQAWTATVEPFAPAAQPGQSVKQRMNKRETDQVTVYVKNSTGFLYADLKSGTTTPTGPALGTIIQQKRIPAWNQDDDPTQPPPLREDAYEFHPLGREYDPRFAVIKDTPGPLTILEIAAERSA